jgi:FtsP/CotA-like multicopper oxidase with cupredoxin domain
MPNKVPLRRAYNLKHQTPLRSVAAAGAFLIASFGWLCGPVLAQPANPCARFASGSLVQDPPALVSQNGTLTVNLTYNTGVDANGMTLYCFTTPEGDESPTLYVNPGDTLIVNVKNNLPAPVSANAMKMSTGPADTVCGDPTMDASSVNLHYHGTNTPPTCHADEVIHTMINSGQTFTYTVPFPTDEPPGLYWYHPHIHGLSEKAVQGGASGAIIVKGVQNIQPKVAGLNSRVLVIRDQPVPQSAMTGDPNQIPAWDVSLNYVPILYPSYQPALIKMGAKERQFWRVVNASADTIIDLQLKYDKQVQTLQVVSLDGVPTGSQDGSRKGKIVNRKDILLPPAARAEFIVVGPSPNVKSAILSTLSVNTGPDGDLDPTRPLAQIGLVSPDGTSSAAATLNKLEGAAPVSLMPQVSGAPGPQRFEGLATAKVTAKRKLYFSEFIPAEGEPTFFITVDGATPVAFSPDNPPAITTTQGSVEDWTIENRSGENHEFHIHQIHFLLLARNGNPVLAGQSQYLDMVNIPFWKGKGPYPSVKVRMDFRGPDIGDFVYHCHILEHEDNGMMAIIRVLPGTGATGRPSTSAHPAKQAAILAPASEGASSQAGVKLVTLAK